MFQTFPDRNYRSAARAVDFAPALRACLAHVGEEVMAADWPKLQKKFPWMFHKTRTQNTVLAELEPLRKYPQDLVAVVTRLEWLKRRGKIRNAQDARQEARELRDAYIVCRVAKR